MALKIGFDAKRYFFNNSGLGNYSRSSVSLLSKYYPEDDYVLFSPKHTDNYHTLLAKNNSMAYPTAGKLKKVPSLWRSYGMSEDINKNNIQIYHGLSNEIPYDILKASCKSVVTIHDLIFVHMPHLYKPFDRFIYKKKYRDSCNKADKVIAISRQTHDDLVNIWNVPTEKIDVVYQGCNSIFYDMASDEHKENVRLKYNLPREYILSVGTIEERKNLGLTLKAMKEGNIDMPLVACGRQTPYTDELKKYVSENNMTSKVLFIHNVDFEDLPAIYQMANVSVYASKYEGFGIPIIESLNSHTPMITSKGGVFSETGGDACIYIDNSSVEEMIDALNRAINDTPLRKEMISKGLDYVKRFADEEVAKNIHAVYEKLY